MDHQDWKPVTYTKLKKVDHKTQCESTQKKSKLDNETESFVHKQVDTSFKVEMQKARLKAKITQKELATRLNVKVNIINSYETGTCIPNNAFIAKIDTILKSKLPRAKKVKN